jgi:hypothetical protein
VPVVNSPFLVSDNDVDKFDQAIAVACILHSEEPLEQKLPCEPDIKGYAIPKYFYRDDGCLVISFDGYWYPFLDSSKGYNRGPQRWYIPKISHLIARAGLAMRTPEQGRSSDGRPGGRLFFHASGVLKRGDVNLLTWTLAKESAYLRGRVDRVTLTPAHLHIPRKLGH